MFCKNISLGTISIDTLHNLRGERFRLGPGEEMNLSSPLWPEPRVRKHEKQLKRYAKLGELEFSAMPFPVSRSQTRRFEVQSESSSRSRKFSKKKEKRDVDEEE